MGKTSVYKWFSHFQKGEMSIDDKHRSGRPSFENERNVEKVPAIVL